MVKIQGLRAIRDNYIWVIMDDVENSAYVVDPGEAAPVKDFLAKEKLDLKAILLTHQHWDHVTGIPELCDRFGCPVFGPKIERHPTVTHAVSEGDELRLWDRWPCKVIETPGHLPDHISWVLDLNAVLHVFCADTLFSAGCGRMFRGTPEEFLRSLKRLAALPDNSLLYPAHEYTLSNLQFARSVEPGNTQLSEEYQAVKDLRDQGKPSLPTTVAREKRINPFLRCQQPALIEAVARHAGRALPREEDVFAELRHWKDVF